MSTSGSGRFEERQGWQGLLGQQISTGRGMGLRLLLDVGML